MNRPKCIVIITYTLACLAVPVLGEQAVYIRSFSEIPTNTPVNISISIDPNSVTNITTLEILTLSGTGSAIFTNTGSTSLSITQSCLVSLLGVTPSDAISNMVLVAYSGQQPLASNRFTIITNTMLTAQQAVDAARIVAEPISDIQSGVPITVVLTGSKYVVTFGIVLPPDSLGPDYAAQVELNAFTGEVLLVLGSS